jgi:hypothetical protein
VIDRREILDTAEQTSLTPHIVEKDHHRFADFLASNHQLSESGAI